MSSPGAMSTYRIFWFGVAGCSAFAVDGLLLCLMVSLGYNPRFIRPISIGLAWTTSWLINRSKTFGEGLPPPSIGEAARYGSASLVGLSVNLGIFEALVSFVPSFEHLPVLALAVATGFSMTINYLMYSNHVFK